MNFWNTISSAVATPETILQRLCAMTPMRLDTLPNSHGIYALVDHDGEIRYIGVTASPSVGFHNRIFSRHVAGSEGRSHKFSHAYNTGRMWQARDGYPGQLDADAKVAKKIRAEFCRTYCKAVYVELPRDGFREGYFQGLTRIEGLVQALAPPSMRLWEGRNFREMDEPSDLLNDLLDRMRIDSTARTALMRQAELHEEWKQSPGKHNRAPGILVDALIPRLPRVDDIPSAAPADFNEGENESMQNSDWYVMRPQKAQAHGRPVADGFLVRKGSTAMVDGSPLKKRDRHERDRLVRQGILVPHVEPELYVFSRDHIFNSSSLAGGIVKDGNCSGPKSWQHLTKGLTLADIR